MIHPPSKGAAKGDDRLIVDREFRSHQPQIEGDVDPSAPRRRWRGCGSCHAARRITPTGGTGQVEVGRGCLLVAPRPPRGWLSGPAAVVAAGRVGDRGMAGLQHQIRLAVDYHDLVVPFDDHVADPMGHGRRAQSKSPTSSGPVQYRRRWSQVPVVGDPAGEPLCVIPPRVRPTERCWIVQP